MFNKNMNYLFSFSGPFWNVWIFQSVHLDSLFPNKLLKIETLDFLILFYVWQWIPFVFSSSAWYWNDGRRNPALCCFLSPSGFTWNLHGDPSDSLFTVCANGHLGFLASPLSLNDTISYLKALNESRTLLTSCARCKSWCILYERHSGTWHSFPHTGPPVPTAHSLDNVGVIHTANKHATVLTRGLNEVVDLWRYPFDWLVWLQEAHHTAGMKNTTRWWYNSQIKEGDNTGDWLWLDCE